MHNRRGRHLSRRRPSDNVKTMIQHFLYIIFFLRFSRLIKKYLHTKKTNPYIRYYDNVVSEYNLILRIHNTYYYRNIIMYISKTQVNRVM